MDYVLDGILAVTAIWAVFTDLKQRRISNRATFGAAALGLVVRFAMGGGTSLLTGAEGWLAGVALLAIPFALGWMGAGDVKLLAAFGALKGPEFVFEAALFGCIVGGVMALFALARERKLGFTLSNLFIYVRHPLGSVLQSKRRMPFGPALAAGAAASMLLAWRAV